MRCAPVADSQRAASVPLLQLASRARFRCASGQVVSENAGDDSVYSSGRGIDAVSKELTNPTKLSMDEANKIQVRTVHEKARDEEKDRAHLQPKPEPKLQTSRSE